MADTPTPTSVRSRAIFLTVSIAALTMLSFHGFLDQFAYSRVSDTTVESIGLYALSRAINAAISVLQTTEIGVGVASIQMGEILDPINDAIERLSTALVWAIGSLFLQRIVLEVTASAMFQWVFLVIAVTAALSYFPLGFTKSALLFARASGIPKETIYRWQYLSIKIFLIAAIVRFIVPAFLGVSFFVSQMLLQPHLDENKGQLEKLSEEVSVGSEFDLPSAEQLGQEQKFAESDLSVMRHDSASLQERQDSIVQEIEDLNEKVGLRRFVPEMIGGKSPEEEREVLRSQRDNLERQIEALDDRIDIKEEEMACIDRQIAGESCASWLEEIGGVGKAGLERLSAAVETASGAVVVIATVLMAVFAKNILFPLVFLAIAVKCGRVIGRHTLRLGTTLKRDVGQLQAEARHIGPANE